MSNKKLEVEYHKGVRLSMIEMVLADGKVEDSEIQQLQGIYMKVTSEELSEQVLRNEIEKQKNEPSYVRNSLKKLSGYLNDEGKEMIIKAALLVAFADGEFHETEQALLASMASALGMSKSHLNGILNDLVAG